MRKILALILCCFTWVIMTKSGIMITAKDVAWRNSILVAQEAQIHDAIGLFDRNKIIPKIFVPRESINFYFCVDDEVGEGEIKPGNMKDGIDGEV